MEIDPALQSAHDKLTGSIARQAGDEGNGRGRFGCAKGRVMMIFD